MIIFWTKIPSLTEVLMEPPIFSHHFYSKPNQTATHIPFSPQVLMWIEGMREDLLHVIGQSSEQSNSLSTCFFLFLSNVPRGRSNEGKYLCLKHFFRWNYLLSSFSWMWSFHATKEAFCNMIAEILAHTYVLASSLCNSAHGGILCLEKACSWSLQTQRKWVSNSCFWFDRQQ